MEVIWTEFKFLFETIAFFSCCALLVFNRFQNRAVNRIVRAVGYSGFLFLPFAVLLVGCDINGYTHSARMPSPDNTYVARVIVWRGSAIDLPQGTVILRRPFHSNWMTVYSGNWWNDADGSTDPHVIWNGPNELMIERPDTYGECRAAADKIRVTCVTATQNE